MASNPGQHHYDIRVCEYSSNVFAWLTGYRRYLWSLSGALVLIGAFRGALKVIAAKNEEIRRIGFGHEAEVENLNERIQKIERKHAVEIGNLTRRIEELQRDPFDEDVKKTVQSELKKFDEKERTILKLGLNPSERSKVSARLVMHCEEDDWADFDAPNV